MAGIPERFVGAATSLPVGSLFLWGAVGVGKTYAAAGIALKAIEQGMCVRFRSMHALYADLLAHDATDSTDYRRAALENCELLVLDDLGKEKPSEWKFEQLFAIIDYRYARLLMTVFTSNLSLPELAIHYGDDINGQAIVSRIAEMCQQVRLDGADRRLAS